MTRYKVILLLALLLLALIGGVFATPGIIEGKYNRIRKEPPYAVPAATSELLAKSRVPMWSSAALKSSR
jgi:hypothetical protein